MATASKSRRKKKSSPLRVQFSKLFSIFLIVFGASLIFYATFNQGYGWQAEKRVDSYSIQSGEISENLKPVKITLPKLERTLEISDGFVQDNRWTISSTGVSYLVTSGKLGKVGNVVLYGHNTMEVLGGLWKVQKGDILEVTADGGKIYRYEIFERKEVKPNAVDILTQADDSRLTLYTCSGFLDSARFVVVGKLIQESK